MSIHLRISADDPSDLNTVEQALRRVLDITGVSPDYGGRAGERVRRYLTASGVRRVPREAFAHPLVQHAADVTPAFADPTRYVPVQVATVLRWLAADLDRHNGAPAWSGPQLVALADAIDPDGGSTT